MGDGYAPRPLVLGSVVLGSGSPPFVVAELSANHNGSLERALRIIDACADAGAHAVKLQTYRPDSLTLDIDGPGFSIEAGPWAGRRLHELYEEAATPYEWHEALFDRIRARGLVAFSSPFDEQAIELLEALDCPMYKVASAELTDPSLLAAIARRGKPVVLSTGMASLQEVDDAVRILREGGAGPLAVLHCVSGYPAAPQEMRLGTIAMLAERYGVLGGLSDHTVGIAVAVAAAAMGAALIEKHVTIERHAGGVDSAFSLEPHELQELVRGVQSGWEAARLPPSDEPEQSETPTLPFRRSLWVVEDIAQGQAITSENVRALRPAGGLHPRELNKVMGRRAARSLRRGDPLTADALADDR